MLPVASQPLLRWQLQQDNKSKSLLSAINKARTWLLLNKQTNNWKTTVATTDACYALLQSGSGSLNTESKLSIRLGNYTTNNNTGKQQAGTGYFSTHIDGKSVKPEMGTVTVHDRFNTQLQRATSQLG